METIHVTLPDGSVKEVPKGTTAAEIARGISPRLADAAFVAKVYSNNGALANFGDPVDDGGYLIDLRRPLEQDLKLKILTDKDPDSLFVFRHSAAHLLAAAVMELYPDVKLGIGPPVENGFFYEFSGQRHFSLAVLACVQKKMHELAAQDLPNERKYMPKPEALEL